MGGRESSPGCESLPFSFADLSRQVRSCSSDGHVVEVVKQRDKLARSGLAQSSLPSGEYRSQLVAESRELANLTIQFTEFPPEQTSDRATRSPSVTVHSKDFNQLMKGETCPLSWGYPLEVSHFMGVPHPVPRWRAFRSGQDTDSLIMSDTIRSNSGETPELTDCQFLRRHLCFPPTMNSRRWNRIQGQEVRIP